MSTAGTVISIVSVNANPDLCTPCGGQCCKHMPGSAIPTDISPTLDETELYVKLDDLLKTGLWTIDYYEFEGKDHWEVINFPRPAIKGREGLRFDMSMPWGVCVFHSSAGCTFSDADRPSECKALIPQPGYLGHCKQDPSFKQYGHRGHDPWIPFQHLFDELREG